MRQFEVLVDRWTTMHDRDEMVKAGSSGFDLTVADMADAPITLINVGRLDRQDFSSLESCAPHLFVTPRGVPSFRRLRPFAAQFSHPFLMGSFPDSLIGSDAFTMFFLVGSTPFFQMFGIFLKPSFLRQFIRLCMLAFVIVRITLLTILFRIVVVADFRRVSPSSAVCCDVPLIFSPFPSAGAAMADMTMIGNLIGLATRTDHGSFLLT